MLLKELKDRKVINNITNEDKLNKVLNIQPKPSLYVGFDPSFKSLHLGNYLMLVTMKRFINAGYTVYALIGGATGRIGDPSGKKVERALLNENVVKDNANALSYQISSITNCKIINNDIFYHNLTIFDFLREVGKEININYLLEKDIIARRLETGISYAEFSYTLIQGYDFYCLYKQYNVYLQLGGSDQWGNITTGIEIIRKKIGEDNLACGLTLNLLIKADGTKFGKSESGAIYLDKYITSPYLMYQFLINQNDSDVQKLLLSLTFLSVDEINKIIIEHNQKPWYRLAQKKLAEQIVSDIHGKEEYKKCVKISDAFFGGKLSKLSESDLFLALSGMPSYLADQSSYNICDILVLLTVCTSKSQARQLVQSKSICVNNELIDDIHYEISINHALGTNNLFSYIRKGKKNYYIINWKK